MPYRPELDLKGIENQVRELSRETAAFIREKALKITQADIEYKGSHDYVTYVDKTSEKRIVEGLKKILPQAGFITEEGTEKKEGERYNWIVDPLDGTTNFIHGIPFYCISIALQDKQALESPDGRDPIPEGEIILGLVHHISMDQQFHAIWGEPAKLDDRPVSVSHMDNLDNSLIVTGFPYYDFERLDGYMELLKENMRETAGVRRLGSAALDLALVAAGRSEIFYEYSLKPWDVAAGQFLVKQAGGQVCDFSGGSRYLHGREIVCGPANLLEKFLKKLQKHIPGKILPGLLLVFAFLISVFRPESVLATEIREHAVSDRTVVSDTAAGGNPGIPFPGEEPSCQTCPGQVPTLYRFSLHEDIGPAAVRITEKALREAREAEADFILMDLNTFGGGLKEADHIRKLLLDCPVPTFVYIDANAASAGALISIACDSIYMNPAATIGAATVVDAQGKVQAEKYQSYMRGLMRATAQAKGRDPHMAEAMVDKRIALPGISDSGTVLTFTAGEALLHGYCQGIYPDADSALRSIGLGKAVQIRQELRGIDRIIHFLVNPLVSGILILMIVGGIYFELQSPGIGFPLIIAVLGCILYFAPHYIEGLAAHWEILLFLSGLILLVLEIFIIPGFGIAGISGIFLICASLVLALVENWGLDFSQVHPMKLLESFAVVTLSTLAALVSGFYLSKRLFGRPVFGHALALESEQKRSDGFISVPDLSKYRELVGKQAVTLSVMRPSGKIRIGEQVFDANSETGFIDKDTPVRITRFENAQFFVRKA